MLSRTAARARSVQGASQFAAGYAAVRLTHHSDDRPVRIMKTSQVTARLCLWRSRDPRVQIGPFCPRRPFISLSRVQIVGFCPRRWIHVCKSGLFAPVISLFHCHGCRSWVLPPSAFMYVVPNCVKGLLSPGCFAIRRVLCSCSAMNWSARS